MRTSPSRISLVSKSKAASPLRARAQQRTLGRAVRLTDNPLLRYNLLRTARPDRSLPFPVAGLNLQRLTARQARLSSTAEYVAAMRHMNPLIRWAASLEQK